VRAPPLRRRAAPLAHSPAAGLALDVLRHGDGLLLDLLHRADHVEGLLGQVVVGAREQPLEAGDGVDERDELARLAGEDLGDVEGLREEALDLGRVRVRVRARVRVRVRVRIRLGFGFGSGLGFGLGFRLVLATLRARATVILSSSESSSIPRMAMMSWSAL